MGSRIALITLAGSALVAAVACTAGGPNEIRRPTSLFLYPGSPVVQLGDTVTLVGIVGTTDGPPLEHEFPTTFSSSDPSKVTVDSKTGTARGLSPGYSVITGTVGSGTQAISATQQLFVVSATSPSTVVASASLAFSPSDVTIDAGSTVEWHFESVTHTVTFYDQLNVGLFHPVNIGPTSNAVVARTFPSRGTYTYQCSIHPAIIGTINVN